MGLVLRGGAFVGGFSGCVDAKSRPHIEEWKGETEAGALAGVADDRDLSAEVLHLFTDSAQTDAATGNRGHFPAGG